MGVLDFLFFFFKESLQKQPHTPFSVLEQVDLMLPLEALSWSVISGSMNFLLVDQIIEVNSRGRWWFTEKSNIPLFIGALTRICCEWIWVDEWGFSNSCIDAIMWRPHYSFSPFQQLRLTNISQIAFKHFSGLMMQTNRPQQETQCSLITSMLIIYSTSSQAQIKLKMSTRDHKRMHSIL